MKALITGVYGQDGYILSRKLISMGFDVVGIGRPGTDIYNSHLLTIDATDTERSTIYTTGFWDLILADYTPDLIFDLAAYHTSSENSGLISENYAYSTNIAHFSALSASFLLYCEKNKSLNSRLITCGSSLMYNREQDTLIDEESPESPVTGYGKAKTLNRIIAKQIRSLGAKVYMAILFNHDSPFRKDGFFMQKLVKGLIEVKRNQRPQLELGYLDVKIDIGSAIEYCDALIDIGLNSCAPQDYVVATGHAVLLKDIVLYTCSKLDLEYEESIKINVQQMTQRKGGCVFGNSSSLAKNTGWAPKLSAFDVIDQLLDYHLNLRIPTHI